MKTKIFTLAIFTLLFVNQSNAQDVTTVNAKNSDISDNLDLRAVASIFGESSNLEDFERRLNDPKEQISNLDLNNDDQVDYLRVIESVEGKTHLVIIQAILEKDVFQDVATVEVEKDNNNEVQVQVVGNTFMYGENYIYEPVYIQRPIIYTTFWANYYRPYYSPWYWNYYPTHYYAWNPYPVFRYRNNINVYINYNNQCNYVNVRRSQRAVALYGNYRSNGYERRYPERSFERRNSNVANRYELDQRRNYASNNRSSRSIDGSRKQNSSNDRVAVRGNSNSGSRATTYSGSRNQSSTVRSERNATQNANVRTRNYGQNSSDATSSRSSNRNSQGNVNVPSRTTTNPSRENSTRSYENVQRNDSRNSAPSRTESVTRSNQNRASENVQRSESRVQDSPSRGANDSRSNSSSNSRERSSRR